MSGESPYPVYTILENALIRVQEKPLLSKAHDPSGTRNQAMDEFLGLCQQSTSRAVRLLGPSRARSIDRKGAEPHG